MTTTTHLSPMLAQPIAKVFPGPKAVEKLLADDGWLAQQKVDGKRILVEVDGGVTLRNRDGEAIHAPSSVARVFGQLAAGQFVFDGELVGPTLHLFDLPVAGAVITPRTPLDERLGALASLMERWAPDAAVAVLPYHLGTAAKQDLFDRVRAGGGEGIIMKRRDSRYESAKRARSWVKVKFTAEVDCVVTQLGIDGKANMELAAFDADGTLVSVAECTALAGDGPRVRIGDVVTVTCLYSSEDNRLVQPTRPLLRDDKRPEECLLDQLDDCRVNKAVLP